MAGKHKLTDRRCQIARHNPRHSSATLLSDGGSLYLRIRENQGKAWIFRYRDRKERGGRVREMGLGSYPEVSLDEARQKADEARKEHRRGVDLIEKKRSELAHRQRIPTFAEAVAEYLEFRSKLPDKGRLEGSSLREWGDTLRLHVAKLHPMRVDAIEPEDVRDAIKAVWASNRSAPRILNRVEQVFARSIALRYRKDNPAIWDIQMHLLGHGQKAGEGHKSLPWQELPAFMERLRNEPGQRARALEFIILTVARMGDVIGDRDKRPISAAEIEGDLWTVPASRMKRRAEHRVPLSSRALEILGQVYGIRKGGNNTLFDPVLRKCGATEYTVHGFRATFKSWAEENGYGSDPRLVEFAMAHLLPNKVEASYNRVTRAEERRVLMQRWADFCGGLETGAKVLPLRRA